LFVLNINAGRVFTSFSSKYSFTHLSAKSITSNFASLIDGSNLISSIITFASIDESLKSVITLIDNLSYFVFVSVVHHDDIFHKKNPITDITIAITTITQINKLLFVQVLHSSFFPKNILT